MSDKVTKRKKWIEIRSPGVPPFRIPLDGEDPMLNAYEWAMIYADLHPYPAHLSHELLKADTPEGMEYRLAVINNIPKALSFFNDLRKRMMM